MVGRASWTGRTPPEGWTLWHLVVFNAVVLGVFALAGALASSVSGAELTVAARPFASAHGIGPAGGDAWRIFTANVHVAALMLAGACSLGTFTLALLSWNGYVLGFGLSSLARGAPECLPLLARYVPLEFLALTLVAAASEHLALMGLRALVGKARVELKGIGRLVMLSLALLAAGALVEAEVMRAVQGMRVFPVEE